MELEKVCFSFFRLFLTPEDGNYLFIYFFFFGRKENLNLWRRHKNQAKNGGVKRRMATPSPRLPPFRQFLHRLCLLRHRVFFSFFLCLLVGRLVIVLIERGSRELNRSKIFREMTTNSVHTTKPSFIIPVKLKTYKKNNDVYTPSEKDLVLVVLH